MTAQETQELAAEVGRMLAAVLERADAGELDGPEPVAAYIAGAQEAARLISQGVTPHRAAGRILRASHGLAGRVLGRAEVDTALASDGLS